MGERFRVGLTTVLVLLSLLLVLCASGITAGLLSAAADTAISNGERTAADGLSTCFATGRVAAAEIAEDVLSGSLEHAKTSILKYLQPAQAIVDQLSQYLLMTPWDLIDDADYRNNTIRATVFSSWVTAYRSGGSVRRITYVNLHPQPGHVQLITFYEDPNTENNPPDGYHHLMAAQSDALPFDSWSAGTVDNTTGHIIPGDCDLDAPRRTNGSRPSGSCPNVINAFEVSGIVSDFVRIRTGVSWTAVTIIPHATANVSQDSVVMQFIASFTHPQMPQFPTFRNKVAVLWVQVDVRRVSVFLREIAAGIIGNRARLYVVQTDPFTNHSGLLLGTSHGELLSGSAGGASGQSQLLNAQDRVVRTHARAAMRYQAPARNMAGAYWEETHAWAWCNNPEEERLELSPTNTAGQCAQQVLHTSVCALEFTVAKPRHMAGSAALPLMACECISNGHACNVADGTDGVYRPSPTSPGSYDVLYPREVCNPLTDGVLRIYSTDRITPGDCYERVRVVPECTDVFFVIWEHRFISCYCVLAGHTCETTGTHEELGSRPQSVFALKGFTRPSSPSTPEATYGRLEGRLDTLNASETDEAEVELWWANVIRVEGGFGLLLHISGLVPVDDMLSGAIQSFKTAKDRIGRESEDNRDDKDRAFRITYIVAACVAAVLLAAAAALPHLVVAPLSGLEADMALVAQMKTDQVRQRELSALTEVRRMQESFRAMLACIDLYKTYLPQSALQAADGGDEDDAELSAASSWTCSGHVHRAPDSSGSDAVALGDSGASRPASRRPSHFTEGADSGLSDSNKGRPVPSAQGELAACIIQRPKQKTLTLLLTNRLGFLKDAVRSAENAVVSMVQSVEAFAVHVQSQKGVVDLCIADHLSATFGAARLCAQHRAAAARSAQLFASAAPRRPAPADVVSLPGQCPDALPVPPQVTSAACAGAALCGDFGSSAGGRRYMIIGGLSSFALALERIGAASRIPLLVDSKVHADIATTWNLRARFLVSYPKRGSPNPVTLWEGLKEAVTDANNEWMYNLEKKAANIWEGYNAAAVQWFRGCHEEASKLHAKALESAEAAEGELCAALAALGAALEAGRPALQTVQELHLADSDVPSARARESIHEGPEAVKHDRRRPTTMFAN